MKDIIYKQLGQHGLIFDTFIQDDHQINQIELAAACMIDTLKQGGKILACGNGGSMSDAMHFVSELVGKYCQPRPAYAAMALSDQGTITCISNDFGYNEVFRRQVEAIGRHGDTLLALSTSGESHNVVRAAHFARSIGMKVVAITGFGGGQLRHNSHVMVEIPHKGDAGPIQEMTIMVIHVLVSLIEENLK